MSAKGMYTVKEVAHEMCFGCDWVRKMIRRLLGPGDFFKYGTYYLVTEDGLKKLLRYAASPRPRGRPKKEKGDDD